MRIRSDRTQPSSTGGTAPTQAEGSAGGSKSSVPSTPLKSLGIALSHIGGKALAPKRQQLKLSRALEKGDRVAADHYVGKMANHNIEPSRKNDRGYADMQMDRRMEELDAGRKDLLTGMIQEWSAGPPAGTARHPIDELKRSFAAELGDRDRLLGSFDRLAAAARTDNVLASCMLNNGLLAALHAHDAMSPQHVKQLVLNGLQMHRAHEAQGLADPNYFNTKQLVDNMLLSLNVELGRQRAENRGAFSDFRAECDQLSAALRDRTTARPETSPASSRTAIGQDDEIRPMPATTQLPRLR